MATKTKTKPAPAEVRAPAPSGARAGVLPIDDLRPSPGNPRKSFPEQALADLAADIRAKGVLQRIIVRPIPQEGHPAPRFDPQAGWVGVDHFEIVAGERRWRAARLAGLDRVPVDVREYSDEQAVLLAQISENDHRADVAPSEQAAAYKRLADAGRTLEEIAQDTGKQVAFVRGLLRLGRLPAWALVAVDAGVLPRATAELVAGVPGEESRKKAAACALQGAIDPRDVVGTPDHPDLRGDKLAPLSYRDTRHLIQVHFTKELKGSPFSLTVLYGEIPACDTCPKRAGNDPEATAEGTRADVCLDPECYRAKVEAYRADEIAKAATDGIEHLDTDERFAPKLAPRGYCDPTTDVWQTELHTDFPIGAKRRDESLAALLGKAELQRYMAFAADGKPRVLVRTADARKALQDAKVLKRPEPRPSATAKKPSMLVGKSDPSGIGKTDGPTFGAVVQRATVLAANVLAEFAQEQCEALTSLDDAEEDGPILDALRFVARVQAYDSLVSGYRISAERDVIMARFPGVMGRAETSREDEKIIDATIAIWNAPKALAFLVQLSAAGEMQLDGPNRDTARHMLEWCELDWPQLQEQARRELTGGEPAEAKIAAAERAAEPKAKPKKGAKSK